MEYFSYSLDNFQQENFLHLETHRRQTIEAGGGKPLFPIELSKFLIDDNCRLRIPAFRRLERDQVSE
jgi:hypothetical protein